jgi:hypothetical protein
MFRQLTDNFIFKIDTYVLNSHKLPQNKFKEEEAISRVKVVRKTKMYSLSLTRNTSIADTMSIEDLEKTFTLGDVNEFSFLLHNRNGEFFKEFPLH